MESDWRQNVAEIGWQGQQVYAPGIIVTMNLCAKLVTPLHVGGFTLTHVCQIESGGVISGTFGAASLLDPDQVQGFLFTLTGRFPYGRAVLPD